MNWSLFEQPGLDLDQIDVPIIELDEFALPTSAHIRSLIDASLANLEAIGEAIEPHARNRIMRELEQFPFDPGPVYAALGDPMLGKEYGTHFLIKPTSVELGLDLALSQLGGKGASALQRYLLGFGNTMHGEDLSPPIVAEFVEHRNDGSSEDLIGPLAFFTPEEFASADHHIRGGFDEYGTFRGTVRIYDQVEHDYTLAPPDDVSGRVDSGLDTAFVGHRMLLGHDTEAREFAMNLFLLQMKGLLSLPKHLGSALGDEELSAWFDERFGYPDAADQLRTEEMTTDSLRDCVIKGSNKQHKAHKLLFLPESKENVENVCDVERKISQDFARFSTFVREPKGYNSLPNDWIPTLTLGTVVKFSGDTTQYFLCIQPACDTVRIKEERYFPFIELVPKKPTKSTENLVIRDEENNVVVCVNNMAGSRHYDKFIPDESHTIRATRYKEGEIKEGGFKEGDFLFNSKNNNYYCWIGDIDPLKAQRIATDVSSSLARVGIDEYEWLRLGGSAKK